VGLLSTKFTNQTDNRTSVATWCKRADNGTASFLPPSW